ncbi:MAG: hypothetical protein IJV43_07955, partial [Oscillospiraceae bacterium]|nr:hypothetical protein [Oscillospiraceae bacterium]
PDAPPPAPAQTPEPPQDDGVLKYAYHGLEIPIPTAYLELLVIDGELDAWNAHRTPLVSFAERASVEAGQLDHPDEDWGDGMFCIISRLDRIGFEYWISEDEPGTSVFAKDDGDAYYLVAYPTDVRIYRAGGTNRPTEEIEGWNSWVELCDWAESLPEEIVALNGLTAYDASELWNADYTYGGEHAELGFRVPGNQPMDLVLLSLSQPAKQGDGGVWCVERVRYVYGDYDFTDTHLVFPAALGVDEAAADYYARLQAECDAGERPELLTPRGAAVDYARRAAWLFGEDVSATDFEIIDSLG